MCVTSLYHSQHSLDIWEKGIPLCASVKKVLIVLTFVPPFVMISRSSTYRRSGTIAYQSNKQKEYSTREHDNYRHWLTSCHEITDGIGQHMIFYFT